MNNQIKISQNILQEFQKELEKLIQNLSSIPPFTGELASPVTNNQNEN